LGLNIAMIAVCGVGALAKGVQTLFVAHAISRVRAGMLVVAWVLIAGTVGGQAAFFMRPFFGFPATRGGSPPMFLGAAPDLRGATNFFEAVRQTIERPALPTDMYR